MKFVALFVLLFAVLAPAHADEIYLIDEALVANSPIPVSPSAALILATNIWNAHETTPYALTEPDSLALSIAAVDRAILYESDRLIASLTEIWSANQAPIPFLQSKVAIDDRVSSTLTPVSLNFGDVVILTPEPSCIWLTALSLLALALWRRSRAASS